MSASEVRTFEQFFIACADNYKVVGKQREKLRRIAERLWLQCKRFLWLAITDRCPGQPDERTVIDASNLFRSICLSRVGVVYLYDRDEVDDMFDKGAWYDELFYTALAGEKLTPLESDFFCDLKGNDLNEQAERSAGAWLLEQGIVERK